MKQDSFALPRNSGIRRAGIAWRIFTDAAFRAKWFLGQSISGTRHLLEQSDESTPLLQYGPEDFAVLAAQLDRDLLKCVLFGRPPETLGELIDRCRNEEGNPTVRTDYLMALWSAMTDERFRSKCFGNARRTLEAYGFELSEEELGKFRWFDEEKIAKFTERIDAAIVGPASSGLAGSTQDEASDPYLDLYNRYCAEVDELRKLGVELSRTAATVELDAFDPGPPAPDYVSFLNVLQSLRVHGSDINRVLEDTGFSVGRVLMLVHLLRRRRLPLPSINLKILSSREACEDWFINISRGCRPELNEKLHQSPCDPRAVIGRVAHIQQHNWLRNRRVLVLGDDDGLSVAIARFTEAKVTVVDIDPDVLSFLQDLASRANVEIECLELDLRDPLPSELIGAFWLVTADPPQNLPGEKFFLDRAVDGLVDELGSRIYASITPMWMGTEAYHGVLAHMSRHGFSPREIQKSQMVFNVRHPFDPQPSGMSDVEALVEQLLSATINMACDVHVLQRMTCA